jgi:hypothetical protein
MRLRIALISAVVITIVIVGLVWHSRSKKVSTAPDDSTTSTDSVVISGTTPSTKSSPDSAPTKVYAHNLMLRKGEGGFRVYVRWLRGQMVRTLASENPSFDDTDSFVLEVKTGVVRTNVGDLQNFLNNEVPNSPLKKITLVGDGDTIKLRGTLHKGIPLPIEVIATIGVASGNRIHIHVTKINVLKIPFKALLGSFGVTAASLVHSNVPGIQVSDNDIFLDTQKLLPPPHIHGDLTSVRVVNPDVEEIYGNATEDLTRVAEWRNYLQLSEGTIDFGKLTMHHVDLIMVDLSNDAWFDLDLAHYQDQLVNGYTRMTPEAGLQIFMPSLDKLPKNGPKHQISMEWLKHRTIAPPKDVTSR